MAVTLTSEEQELVLEEVRAFGAVLQEAGEEARYRALAEAVERGEVPDDALGLLGQILGIGLQTGRIRKLHRASGEQALLRVFARTPAGAAHHRALAELNRALEQLAGQRIEAVRATARVPGSYLLLISTEDCELTLRFTPDEAGVESVAVGV